MRDDQLRFQSDIRSTLTTLQNNQSGQQKEGFEQRDDGFVVGESSSTGEPRGGRVGVAGSAGRVPMLEPGLEPGRVQVTEQDMDSSRVLAAGRVNGNGLLVK